jgi:integrase
MQTEQESSTAVSHQHTFGAQSEAWLEGLAQRKRRPVAPSTLDTFSSRVRRLLPIVGADTLLRDIHNGFLKDLASKLAGSAKTVNELLAVVKAVVASAVDSQTGDPLYPRTWNHSFIDAPTISGQKQPCATAEEVNRAITNATSHQEQLFYALLAGAGLRVAEALSIHVSGTEDQTSWDQSTSTIAVCSSIYCGKEQNRVKTEAAKRVVDLDPRLNAAIICFVAERNIQPGSFLFQSRSGRAMHLRTARKRLDKHGILGFHTFRRFRITRLRELGTPEDIVRYWVGHAGEGITDRYSKLAENVELRKEWARRAGLGFELDKVGHPAPKLPLHPKAAKPGTCNDPKAEIVVKRNLVRRKPVLSVPNVVEPPTSPAYVASDEDLDPAFFEQAAPGPTQEELEAELARLAELRAILGVK